MRLLIDNANLELIKQMYEYYPVDGVTTNPSILAKEKRPPFEVLREIRKWIGPEADLHAQVIARDAEGMVTDAERICRELGDNTFVKIPVNREGLKATKLLYAKGIRVTGTAVYTRMQGWLAGKAGASYVAPYVNRIDNLGGCGVQTAKDIHDMLRKNNIACDILAASFKNSQQVQELALYGAGAATVSPDVMEGFIRNTTVDSAVDAFISDFEGLTSPGMTMAGL